MADSKPTRNTIGNMAEFETDGIIPFRLKTPPQEIITVQDNRKAGTLRITATPFPFKADVTHEIVLVPGKPPEFLENGIVQRNCPLSHGQIFMLLRNLEAAALPKGQRLEFTATSYGTQASITVPRNTLGTACPSIIHRDMRH